MSWTDSIGHRPTYYADDVVIGHAADTKLIVTHVGRLTDSRRLAIGRRLWALSHDGYCDAYDDATESERLRWTRTHMGRYEDVTLETDPIGFLTGYTTSTSGCGGYPAGTVHLMHVSEV